MTGRPGFQQQMELANARPEKGLYVSLRLDGRVRASGTGSPPWHRFANELPPVKGAPPFPSHAEHLLTASHFRAHLRFLQALCNACDVC